MNENNIGEIIKAKREEKGITQSDLADGICEPQSLSRIERGTQNPRHDLLIRLFGRLGISSNRLFGICSLEDLNIEEYILQIKIANNRGEFEEAIRLRNELEEKHGCESNILKQFLIWTDAINGRMTDGKIVHYSAQDKLDMLNEAIILTVKDFGKKPIAELSLGITEVKIIQSVANVYCDTKDYIKAIDIYKPLLAYVDKNFIELLEGGRIIPLLTYNYSKALGNAKRDTEALAIAEHGISYCQRYQSEGHLGKLLINKSCSLYALGRKKDGFNAAIRSYYVLDSMGLYKDANQVFDHIIKTYDYTPI